MGFKQSFVNLDLTLNFFDVQKKNHWLMFG